VSQIPYPTACPQAGIPQTTIISPKFDQVPERVSATSCVVWAIRNWRDESLSRVKVNPRHHYNSSRCPAATNEPPSVNLALLRFLSEFRLPVAPGLTR